MEFKDVCAGNVCVFKDGDSTSVGLVTPSGLTVDIASGVVLSVNIYNMYDSYGVNTIRNHIYVESIYKNVVEFVNGNGTPIWKSGEEELPKAGSIVKIRPTIKAGYIYDNIVANEVIEHYAGELVQVTSVIKSERILYVKYKQSKPFKISLGMIKEEPKKWLSKPSNHTMENPFNDSSIRF